MDAQGAFPATLRISHRWVDLEDFIWSALAAVRAKLRQPSFASLDEFCRQPSAGNRFLMEFNGQTAGTSPEVRNYRMTAKKKSESRPK
jgi:hypothetical protein